HAFISACPNTFLTAPNTTSDISVANSGLRLPLHSFPTRRSSDLAHIPAPPGYITPHLGKSTVVRIRSTPLSTAGPAETGALHTPDRKSTRLNSSHVSISYAVFCLKQKSYSDISRSFINNSSTTFR